MNTHISWCLYTRLQRWSTWNPWAHVPTQRSTWKGLVWLSLCRFQWFWFFVFPNSIRLILNRFLTWLLSLLFCKIQIRYVHPYKLLSFHILLFCKIQVQYLHPCKYSYTNWFCTKKSGTEGPQVSRQISFLMEAIVCTECYR